jgi:hypothetical protein
MAKMHESVFGVGKKTNWEKRKPGQDSLMIMHCWDEQAAKRETSDLFLFPRDKRLN